MLLHYRYYHVEVFGIASPPLLIVAADDVSLEVVEEWFAIGKLTKEMCCVWLEDDVTACGYSECIIT